MNTKKASPDPEVGPASPEDGPAYDWIVMLVGVIVAYGLYSYITAKPGSGWSTPATSQQPPVYRPAPVRPFPIVFEEERPLYQPPAPSGFQGQPWTAGSSAPVPAVPAWATDRPSPTLQERLDSIQRSRSFGGMSSDTWRLETEIRRLQWNLQTGQRF